MFTIMRTSTFLDKLDERFEQGYVAGKNYERLVKVEADEHREYDLLCRGAELERQRILKEVENTIEEISAEEFAELAGIDREPFGFVGTMDDMSLVLEEDDK